MIEALRQILIGHLNIEISSDFFGKLVNTLILIILIWGARLLALRLVNRRFLNNPRALYSWRKSIKYSTVVLLVLLVGRLWFEGIQSLATFLGIVSAGLVIALQDPIINMAGWVFIIWQRPYAVGDRIQIGTDMGDVIDITLFQTSLLEIGKRIDAEQSTGRIIHVPNGTVFRQPLVNTHQGLPLIWNEIPVLITFESSWEKAKAILQEIVQQNAPEIDERLRQYERRGDQRFVIAPGNTSPIVYTSVEASGVLLTLRYLVAPRQKRISEQTMWEAILRAFASHMDIDFAYETKRAFLNFREGKEAGQAETPVPSGEISE